MDRSKQLSEVTRKSKDLLTRRSVLMTPKEFDHHLRQTVNLLYTHQDYTDHLKLPLANDLAWLPNEVIDGVLESEACGEAFYEDFANLALLNGSWADFGREFATADRKLRSSGVENTQRNYAFASEATVTPPSFCDLSMDRARQLSAVVSKCVELQHTLETVDAQRITLSDFKNFLRQSIRFLYADQRYTEHLKLNFANDFANLPKTIVQDVVHSTDIRDAPDATELALIQGSWAEFAQCCCCFSSTRVESWNDLSELIAKAPQLYGLIIFESIPDLFVDALELLDTRFAEVVWYEALDCRRSESAMIQITKFFKRQLYSSYFRKMTIYGGLRIEEPDEVLVELVKKPQFELLQLFSTPLPFLVIEEAFTTWESTNQQHFAVQGTIRGTISDKTLKRIEKRFRKNLLDCKTNGKRRSLRWQSEHPCLNEAQMEMSVCAPANRSEQCQAIYVTMLFTLIA